MANRLSQLRLIAITLASSAFAMDELFWVLQEYVMAPCHGGRIAAPIIAEILFATPFLLVLAGLLVMMRLPQTRLGRIGCHVLIGLLTCYLLLSAMMWSQEFWSTYDCIYDVMDASNFVPSFVHLFLILPCGAF